MFKPPRITIKDLKRVPKNLKGKKWGWKDTLPDKALKKKKKKSRRWNAIERDPADIVFSEYIRRRDKWTCVRCERDFSNQKGKLHCSHYWVRGKESTRFDPQNCDALCIGCHNRWETQKHEKGMDGRPGEYYAFKMAQLGRRVFNILTMKANCIKAKKDRKMSMLIAQGLLDGIKKEEEKGILGVKAK